MLVRDNDGRSRIKLVFSPFSKQGSLFYGISSDAGVHAITQKPVNAKEDEITDANGVQEDSVRDNAVQGGRLDLDLKPYDLEFSDFDVDDILSGQPNA
jgi:hypothetical protein